MSDQPTVTHEEMRDEILAGELAGIQDMVRRLRTEDEQ